VRTFGLPGFAVVTSDDTNRHKPDPEGLQLAMQRLGVTPEESAVFGDHKYDMQVAINAGTPVRIGVTHGFDDRPTLEAADATHVIDSLKEIPAILGV
jgi:phosphoglycolate phosphatase-like HAD superfamily hydrolase